MPRTLTHMERMEIAEWIHHIYGHHRLTDAKLFEQVQMMVTHHAMQKSWLYIIPVDANQCLFYSDWDEWSQESLFYHLIYPPVTHLPSASVVFAFFKRIFSRPPTRKQEAFFMYLYHMTRRSGSTTMQSLGREYKRVIEGINLDEKAVEEARCEKTSAILQDFMCKDVAQMVVEYTK